jgi:hypothetical protein
MGPAVVVIVLRPDGHQPPSTVRFKGDTRWPNPRLRTIRIVELIDVPEGGLFQRCRQRLLLNNAASDLTSALGGILNANGLFLSSAYRCKEQHCENDRPWDSKSSHGNSLRNLPSGGERVEF